MASSREQVQAVIANESDMTVHAPARTASAGAVAAAGIVTGALHVAVGAFIVALGFEAIVRIPLGVAART